VINTANTQIEQLFNNILRAGAGQGVNEQTIITDGRSNATGGGLVDPIFLNWTNGQLQSITDVTPGTKNSYGFSGSYTDIASGNTQKYN
jgi:hypothetical protein